MFQGATRQLGSGQVVYGRFLVQKKETKGQNGQYHKTRLKNINFLNIHRFLIQRYLIHQGLVACQYVDDTTVPCPSGGAVEAVMLLRHESAAKRYATKTKYGAAFQQGANKSNVMSLGHSPPLLESEIGCSIVEKRNLLGFYMDKDKDLTFQHLLAETLAKSWKKIRRCFMVQNKLDSLRQC